MDRNDRNQINTDIEFLTEMLDLLENASKDGTQYQKLKEMILDWREELEILNKA